MLKILIYAACIFACASINVLIGYAGFRLGGLPTALLYLTSLTLANFLSKKFCKPKDRNEDEGEGDVK